METINYNDLQTFNNDDKKINIVSSKIRILKDGLIKIYTYDQKIYNDTYYNLYKEKLLKLYKCDCGAHYNILNRARHFKTTKHINNINKNKKVDDEKENENLAL